MFAAELITEETRKALASWNLPTGGVNDMKVDYFLWDYRLMNAEKLACIPYHRVRGIYY